MPGKSRQSVRQPVGPAKVYRKGLVNPMTSSQKAVPMNRGSSVNRAQARVIKRQAVNQAANERTARPRPVVRPAAPPQRVMPKVPEKKPVPLVRPLASPSASAKLKALRKSAVPSQVERAEPSEAAKQGKILRAAGLAAGAVLVLNTAEAHADISTDVNALNSSLEDLTNRSSFAEVQSDAHELDADIKHLLSLLESAREKGYIFQKDLEHIAYESLDQWESTRGGVLTSVEKESRNFQTLLRPLGSDVRKLNMQINNPAAAIPLLGSTKSKVDKLLSQLDQTQRNIEGQYDSIETDVFRVTSKLTTIHWALSQLEEAKFRLGTDENLVMAVPARWDQEGKDDPEGILFLTNRRMIFERKEKIARKKVLFISVEKELVHEVLIDQPITNIKNTKAENKGLFGHQDFIQVDFSDAKLGTISFHLDGQDSKEWVIWIDKVHTGEIAQDRVAGSGISLADLSGPITSADILAVQNEVNQLQNETMLRDVKQELAGIENDMRELERKLADLRARGYDVEKSLEADISILSMQWDRINKNAETTLDNQTRLLSDQMKQIQTLLAELVSLSDDLNAARPIYLRLKSAIASTEAQADAAEDTVITQYDEYADEIEILMAHLEWIDWMLDALSTASFQLLATESGIAAVESVWERPGLEPEHGILFLTDQRLLWEDRVDDYELKLDLPLKEILSVESIVDSKKGDQGLEFSLADSAPYPAITYQLDLPVADSWLKMIGRARSGDYLKDRSVEIDPAEIERIQNAPTQCSNCGAAYTAPILRGQVDIICEYCGTITRI